MKLDEPRPEGAADAVAISKPLVPIERASPERAIHVSFMIENPPLLALEDEPIAVGVACELRVRRNCRRCPRANMG
jgi:hypothetical protein